MSIEIKAKNIVQFLSALVLVLIVVFLPRILIKLKSNGDLDIPQKLINAELNEDNIKAILKYLEDPEFNISIIDFGLVRKIKIDENKNVTIHIIYTTPTCPFKDVISANIKEYVVLLNSVKSVEVVVDKNPTWSKKMMTEEGRLLLKGNNKWKSGK